jgi:hypothetical protein
VSESESDSSVVVMWNCELSLQFSFRSSSPLLFVFEGGNWYLDWYADFDFMMLVCNDFGFILELWFLYCQDFYLESLILYLNV